MLTHNNVGICMNETNTVIKSKWFSLTVVFSYLIFKVMTDFIHQISLFFADFWQSVVTNGADAQSIALSSPACPIPHNLPLPYPAPVWLVDLILVSTFIAHIIFVQFMVGGSIFVLIAEFLGLKNKIQGDAKALKGDKINAAKNHRNGRIYDSIAYYISSTITVNKSIAVVLGVGPLLCLNLIYTNYFYAANALTGYFWISLVYVITTLFLFLYLHKYTWKIMQTNALKAIHIFIMFCCVSTFLFVPLIFLTNINLMLFPEKWTEIRGFFSAMILDNVFPRYSRFIGWAIIMSSSFVIFYTSQMKMFGEFNWFFKKNVLIPSSKNNKISSHKKEDPHSMNYTNEHTQFSSEEITELNQIKAKMFSVFYAILIFGVALQLVSEICVMLTLPAKGLNIITFTISVAEITLLIASLPIVIKAMIGQIAITNNHLSPQAKHAQSIAGKLIWAISLIMLTALCMFATSRHYYRVYALSGHQKLVDERTQEYQRKSLNARKIAAIYAAEVSENGELLTKKTERIKAD